MWQKDSQIYYRDFIERIEAASYVFFAAFSVIVGCLFFVQIIRGGYYFGRSEQNRLYMLPEKAARGEIFDSSGLKLAGSVTAYGVVFYPFAQSQSALSETIDKVSGILGTEKNKTAGLVLQAVRSGRVAQISHGLSRRQLFELKEEQDFLGGISITGISTREYPDSEINSHLLGYIGEADPAFLEQNAHLGYRQGDIIGKSGMESLYDGYLRGDDGGWQIEVDVLGKHRRFLNYVRPQKGYNLRLFVDAGLQRTAYEQIMRTGHPGAAVAIEPATGKVLLFVSAPGYGAEKAYSPAHSTKKFWDDVLNSPQKPLLNRAVAGTYPPGSVFKIMTFAAALLRSVPPETSFFCPGKFEYGNKTFKCWKKEGHGRLNLKGALANSCNVYFYQLGLRLGAESIVKTARLFNVDKITGVDFPYERSGSLPSKIPQHGGGESINIAIGQGPVLVTPMQMAQLAAIIATRGKIMKPIIAESAEIAGGERILLNKPVKTGEVNLPQEVWDGLTAALEAVVKEGTGRACDIPGVRAAGKTGTAQNPHGKDHAWFVCFAGRQNDPEPGLALAVVVENGGSGGSVAAPIAGKILEKYFTLGSTGLPAAPDYGD